MKKLSALLASCILLVTLPTASSCTGAVFSRSEPAPATDSPGPAASESLAVSSTADAAPDASSKTGIALSRDSSNEAAAPPDVPALIARFNSDIPKQWGEAVTGVKTRLDTTDKVVALTFDACGGKGGSGYDKALIDYLIQEKVPATLFINSRWIDENRDVFLALSKNSLFELENYGSQHRPLSVTGKSAHKIKGTLSVSGVIDEVLPNADKLYKLTGRKPLFFRSGADYYDEVAAAVVLALGQQPVSYSVLGDTADGIIAAVLNNTTRHILN
jgi:peptidoglycan/xylan/chitin deacetylase (PgdA/CDA1 family)